MKALVVQILSGTSKFRRADLREIPRNAADYKIDSLVYDAYELTASEIDVVEKGIHGS